MATGLQDVSGVPNKPKQQRMGQQSRQIPQPQPQPQTTGYTMPNWDRSIFSTPQTSEPRAPQAAPVLQQPNVTPTVKTQEIQIPDFLKNRNR
jgi:hypothetical protein